MIIKKELTYHTPWFKVIAKYVNGFNQPYFALEMSDYVTVLAITDDNKILLVEQYRPVLETSTLEFPSGHIEKNEIPKNAAKRELFEETGYRACEMILLGDMYSDTGRHENKLWGYFANEVKLETETYQESSNISVKHVPISKFKDLINDGKFKL